MSIADGLIHLWPMDETSGTLAEDVAGDLGFAGIVDPSSTETIIDSATGFGKARNLAAPANGAYLDLYTGTADGGTYSLSAWTISVRYRYLAAASNVTDFPNMVWHGTGETGATNIIDWYVKRSTNQMGVSITDSGGSGLLSEALVTADVDDGNWYRSTLTCDGTTLSMYHGTELVNSVSISNPLVLYPKNVPFNIGTYLDPSVSLYPAGVIDDAAIWNRALTQAEVQSSAFQNDPIPDPRLPPFDWTDAISLESSTRYTVLDIEHGTLPTIRVPISSWQSTTQSGQSSFSQAVIPGALTWVDAISDRLDTGVMVITHGVRHIDGTTQEWEVIRAPIQQFFFDRGGMNATARISSYYTVAAVTPASIKTLRNIRSISTSSAGLRVRCDFDPTLKPGDMVSANGSEYAAAYINAYENSSDRYMDVGERAI